MRSVRSLAKAIRIVLLLPAFLLLVACDGVKAKPTKPLTAEEKKAINNIGDAAINAGVQAGNQPSVPFEQQQNPGSGR